MTHQDWIKEQFKAEHTKNRYRDVLIHASFVETIVKEEANAKGMNFECAIKILKANNKYRSDKIYKIDELRIKRNKIIHELLKDRNMGDKLIVSTIDDIHKLLREIYSNSSFIQNYFKKEYQIDTKKF